MKSTHPHGFQVWFSKNRFEWFYHQSIGETCVGGRRTHQYSVGFVAFTWDTFNKE